MKQLIALTKRNLLEILRDPLAAVFCIAFPVVMLTFMQAIFSGFEFVPENFQIENYSMGICVFGYAFAGMFLAMNVAADKSNSFLKRILISPVKKTVYLLSFLLSGLLVVVCQTLLFFTIALLFKLPFDGRLPLAVLYLLPSALFYLSLGILVGELCKNEKQTGPINSIVVSLTGVLGGTFMPLSVFSGGMKTFVELLPFCHSVQIAAELYTVGAGCIIPHIFYLLGYIVVIWGAMLLLEKRKK